MSKFHVREYIKYNRFNFGNDFRSPGLFFNAWRGEWAHILAVATPLVTREPQPIWRGESAVTRAFTPRATSPRFCYKINIFEALSSDKINATIKY